MRFGGLSSNFAYNGYGLGWYRQDWRHLSRRWTENCKGGFASSLCLIFELKLLNETLCVLNEKLPFLIGKVAPFR